MSQCAERRRVCWRRHRRQRRDTATRSRTGSRTKTTGKARGLEDGDAKVRIASLRALQASSEAVARHVEPIANRLKDSHVRVETLHAQALSHTEGVARDGDAMTLRDREVDVLRVALAALRLATPETHARYADDIRAARQCIGRVRDETSDSIGGLVTAAGNGSSAEPSMASNMDERRKTHCDRPQGPYGADAVRSFGSFDARVSQD